MKDQALRDCLIKHSITTRGEFVTRPLNIAQAADRRDAFVKVQSCGKRGPHVNLLSVAPCLVGGQQEKAEIAGQVPTLPVTCLVTVGCLVSPGWFLTLK